MDTCAPVVRDIPVAVQAVTCVLIVLTVVVTVPQYVKLARARSSAGLSLPTILLTMWLNIADVGAGIITKWRQLQECSAGWSCLGGLLDLGQTAVLNATTTAVLLQVCYFPPHDGARHRAAAAGTLCAMAALWATAVCVSIASPCGRAPLALARVCGIVAAVCALVQYLPQLHTTLNERSSGSLSVSFYVLQAAGGLIIFAEQAFAARDPWPVWLPFLCSTSMQMCVTSACLWFDYVQPRWQQWRRRGAWRVAAAAQLLPEARSDDEPSRAADTINAVVS